MASGMTVAGSIVAVFTPPIPSSHPNLLHAEGLSPLSSAWHSSDPFSPESLTPLGVV